jgi:iron complex transport system substrate-binding protein
MMANSRVSFYNALKSMGIRVLAIDPPTWDEFPDYIDTLSRIVGIGGGPEKETIETMRESVAVNEPRIAVFLVTNGRTMATCTPDSWAAHIMELAGFSNAASNAVPVSQGSVVAGFGAERLLALGDEIDAVLLQQGAMNTTLAEDFMRDPRFTTMRAVRNGMVFDVLEADISRPSLLRLANGAVHTLRDLVYSREAVK